MSGRRYRIVAVERDGTPIEELSMAQLDSVAWTLKPPGEATFRMMQSDPKVTIPLLAQNEIQIFVDGMDDPWWGVPWKCSDTESVATFTCSSLASYFERSFIDHASLLYDTATEQFDIAWGLIDYAQTFNGAADTTRNRFILRDNSVPASGVTRFREYLLADHDNILDLLLEFPDLVVLATGEKSGFDWDIIGKADGRKLWTPFYPERGTQHLNLALEYGRNMPTFQVDEDATDLTTKTIMTGGNDGAIKIENDWQDDAAAAAPPDGYGQMVSIQSDGNTQDVDELQTKARSYTQKHNHPSIAPTVPAVEVPDALFGVVGPGDYVPLIIKRGRVNIDGLYRVATVTWKPAADKVTLEFVQDTPAA